MRDNLQDTTAIPGKPGAIAPQRRQFLKALALGSLAFTAKGAFADDLTRTPAQTEGPFYPDKLPLDTDNDLLIVNDSITPAVGEITHLSGRVLSPSGSPIRNAQIEIWQVDSKAVYIHTRDSSAKQRDTYFQGFGRFLTSSTGEYYFRTIKPVPYPGRTAHIHFKVKKGGREVLTTQLFVKGHPGNARDGIWRSLPEGLARDAVTVEFAALKDSRIGELTAAFDIVLDV
jgi:protocatechuate 3,4-dioxygenase beta subunit